MSNKRYPSKMTLREHLDGLHQNSKAGQDGLKNFQFLSANANQFVKCSLTYDDLLKRIDLSDILKDRIRDVLARREQLFSSRKWANFIKQIDKLDPIEERLAA